MAAISSAPQPHAASVHRSTRRKTRSIQAQLLLSLLLGDAVAMNSAFVGTYIGLAATLAASGFSFPQDGRTQSTVLLLFNVIFLLCFLFSQLYSIRRGNSRIDEAFKIVTAVSLTVALTLVSNTLLPSFGFTDIPWTREILAFSWLLGIVLTVMVRLIHRTIVQILRRRGFDTRRILIVGAREPGIVVWRTIRRMPELGYRVQGFLSDSFPVGTVVEELPILGTTAQLQRVINATNADEVIVALSGRAPADLLEIINQAEDEAVTIRVYPDSFQLITNNEVSVGDISGLPLISVKNAALDSPWNRFMKRCLDLGFSSCILIAVSPLMILVALLIRIESPGPIFFLQQRVGMDGIPFWVIKFRTMRQDAESKGPGWTTANDPRITRIGQLLRRTSIDELPQFINVLIGEMSVVGPRPEQPRWVEQFSQQIPRYMRRHKEKAGITGWAQVNGLRGDTSIEERTRYDLYYVENWSLLFDIKIILRTMADFLTGRQENAY